MSYRIDGGRNSAYSITMKIRSGKEIRLAREALRLRQDEFASICSIRPETLNRIENGKSSVPEYVDMISVLLEYDEALVRLALKRRELYRSGRLD